MTSPRDALLSARSPMSNKERSAARLRPPCRRRRTLQAKKAGACTSCTGSGSASPGFFIRPRPTAGWQKCTLRTSVSPRTTTATLQGAPMAARCDYGPHHVTQAARERQRVSAVTTPIVGIAGAARFSNTGEIGRRQAQGQERHHPKRRSPHRHGDPPPQNGACP